MSDGPNDLASALQSASQQPLPPGQSTSIPLPRPAGSGAYDRPERARTSHACEPYRRGRERKTKCDGERPACRRCLHTGTACRYGYGKGWRKRKTAEDLSATQRRLARYEALLNEIMPLVPPNIKAMIEEAKEQADNATSTSGGSETAEDGSLGRPLGSFEGNRSPPTSNPRAPLLYPSTQQVPTPSAYPVPSGQYAPPPVRPFESMSPVSTNASVPSRSNIQTVSSPEAANALRLPSITAGGQLIEPSLVAQSSSSSAHQSDTQLSSRERSTGGDGSPKISPASPRPCAPEPASETTY